MKQGLLKTLLCLLFLSACAPKQHITPAFETLEDTKQSFYFQYQRSDEVLSPTQEFELIGPIGGFIRNLADAIADLILEEQDEQFDLEPMTFYVPDLRDFNLNMIQAIELNRVFIRLKNQEGPTSGSLGFIKHAEVLLLAGYEQAPVRDDSVIDASFENDPQDYYDDFRLDEDVILGHEVPEEASLVLSYTRGETKLACAGRCLDMDIHPIDFKSLFTQGYTSYTIYLRLTIDAIPREKLELESVFDIRVDADLFN